MTEPSSEVPYEESTRQAGRRSDASSIVDYLVYAKSYIGECEERHGIDAVEELLDACHSLMHHGVDRYRRPQKISMVEEEIRRKDREAYLQQQVNDLWRIQEWAQTTGDGFMYP